MVANFEMKLAKSIQKVGLWLAEHAALITPKIEGRTHLTITIDYDLTGETATPDIKVEYDALSKEALMALYFEDDKNVE